MSTPIRKSPRTRLRRLGDILTLRVSVFRHLMTIIYIMETVKSTEVRNIDYPKVMKMKHLIFLLVLSHSIGSFAQGELRRVVDLKGYWKFSIGDNPRWANPAYNDISWEKIYVPSEWENEGFSGFDGYAWYRITVDLKNITDPHLFLNLGFIDDVDQVYLNGHLIGYSGSFPPDFYTAYKSNRKYYIPGDLINRNSKNLIAVRVFDTILGGGIIKGDIGIYSDEKYPRNTLLLEGNWEFKEASGNNWNQEKDADNWGNIMVPSLWRSLKKKQIAGEAWYRKDITIPEDYCTEEELVLVLGKVDDFDQTYFNGELIGETNDHRPYGWSTSYQQVRIYKIPKSLIKRGTANQILVKVIDMGGDAGIYEGPLAIVPKNKLEELLRFRD